MDSQEKAYQFVKEAILNLEFRPGQKLRTQSIAAAVDLSRTPVKEALSRLEQEGLVARDEGWGYIVRTVTVKEALDVYKVRESLEVQLARAVIDNAEEERLARLRTQLTKAEAALARGKPAEYRRHTRSFYTELAAIADNACLAAMLSLLDDRLRWFGAIIAARHRDRPRESLRGNYEILAALEARDAAAAEDAVRRHVAAARESFSKYVIADHTPLAA